MAAGILPAVVSGFQPLLDMSRILLLLDHAANRHLLAASLGARNEIIASGADDALDLPFDLCVMDGPALDRLWERARARKAAAQPDFLPFLLVTSRQDIGMATRHLWQTVDDLLFGPIEKLELQARVENLLNVRRLSVELEGRVAERTAALSAANQDLAKSRLAALNLAEDTLQAQQQAEIANTALRRELEERLRAEAALRESEERLRLALNAAHMGTFDWDVPANRITWSHWHEELWGFKPGEFAGTYEAFASRIHPDDLPGIHAEVVRCMAARAPFSREFRVLWPDGSVHWIVGAGEFTFDAAGQPVRMLGVVREITARKRAEEALRASEERYRRVVENFPNSIVCTLDRELRVTFVGGSEVQSFPINPADLKGKRLQEILEPATFAASEPHLRAAFAGQLASYETSYPGGVVFFNTAAPLRDADGAIRQIIVNSLNITARKRAEEALRELSGRLLRLQDEERRRLARELHDTVAQDLAGLAIDLTRLERRAAKLDAPRRRLIAEARAVADATTQAVRTMSYLLHPPLLDELGLAGAVEDYAAGFSKRSGVQMSVRVAPAWPRLPREVEVSLFRVVQESLANVHRHSGSATARIELRAEPRRLQLTVQDAGHGLTAPPGGAPATLGLGVGIAGMKERLRQLGGELTIDSSPQGTTVTAWLPWEPKGA